MLTRRPLLGLRPIRDEPQQAESVLVPIGNDVAVPSLQLMSIQEPLHEYFVGPAWDGEGATRGIEETDALEIERILRGSTWIHVLIGANNSVPFDGLRDFPERAVLTWMNSD